MTSGSGNWIWALAQYLFPFLYVLPSCFFLSFFLIFFIPFCLTLSAFNYCPDTPSAARFLSNVTTGSFLCAKEAHAGLLPVRVHCGTHLFGPPFLLLLLLTPSASLAASSFGLCADGWVGRTGSRRGFVWAEHLSGRGEGIPQPWPPDPGLPSARPCLASPHSQLRPRETEVQLVPEVQMAAWFSINESVTSPGRSAPVLVLMDLQEEASNDAFTVTGKIKILTEFTSDHKKI